MIIFKLSKYEKFIFYKIQNFIMMIKDKNIINNLCIRAQYWKIANQICYVDTFFSLMNSTFIGECFEEMTL